MNKRPFDIMPIQAISTDVKQYEHSELYLQSLNRALWIELFFLLLFLCFVGLSIIFLEVNHSGGRQISNTVCIIVGVFIVHASSIVKSFRSRKLFCIRIEENRVVLQHGSQEVAINFSEVSRVLVCKDKTGRLDGIEVFGSSDRKISASRDLNDIDNLYNDLREKVPEFLVSEQVARNKTLRNRTFQLFLLSAILVVSTAVDFLAFGNNTLIPVSLTLVAAYCIRWKWSE